MASLVVENVRAGIVESLHRVSAAVVSADGTLVAASGDPELRTFMRSAAKPFQAIPLVADGVVERFDVSSEELALACASHSSETRHVRIVRAFLDRLGFAETDLACGAHRALAHDLAITDPETTSADPAEWASASPVTSNCSGKHTGMLALALHHGWKQPGYHESGHPVQQRVKQEVVRYSGLADGDIGEGRDGCGVTAFSMPLSKMAVAYARLGAGRESGATEIVGAMMRHPDLVAGQGRLCTEIMTRYPGAVLAKVGAEGVYGAAFIGRGLGIGLKVEDGHARAAIVALVAILDQLKLDPAISTLMPQFAQLPVLNTRGERVGEMRPAGELSFV